MKIVQIDRIDFAWPDGWADLCFETKVQVAKLSTGLSSFKGTDEVLVWREIFRIIMMTGWIEGKRAWKRWWSSLSLSFEQFEELKKITDWVAEKPNGKPFDHFDYAGERYYVLPERFQNVSSAEWVEGIMDFIALGSENDDKSLDLLIANFQRPERADLETFRGSEKWNGDVREVYNRQRALERAEHLQGLDAGIKIQLLWWYEAQITAFFEEFEDLFRGGDGEARYPDGRGYLMLLKNVAKQAYMGNFETVCATDVITVFAMLTDEVYDAQETEDRIKNKGK